MSYCRSSRCRHDDDDRCDCDRDRDRDYWFRTDPFCNPRYRPIFPRVIQGNVIIPQTNIPIRIILSPFGTTQGFGTTSQASILQSISVSPQTIATGGAVPFDTNLIGGNGFF